MVLTKEAVDKLKAIHAKVVGEKLSDDEAWEIATRLLEFGYLANGGDPGAAVDAAFDENEQHYLQ